VRVFGCYSQGLGEWLSTEFPFFDLYVHGACSLKAEQRGMTVAWSSHLSNGREEKTIQIRRKTLFLSGPGALTRTLESEEVRAVLNQRDTETGKEKEECQTFNSSARTTVLALMLMSRPLIVLAIKTVEPQSALEHNGYLYCTTVCREYS